MSDLISTVAKEVGVFTLGRITDALFKKEAEGDLSKFLAIIREKGIATPNLFRINIFLPKSLSKYSSYGTTLSLLCDASSLPSMNILTQDAVTYGPSKPIPYNVTYGNLMCSFIVEQDMAVKKFFDSWMYTISDPVTHNLNFSDQYETKIEIHQLNKKMESTYHVVLYGAYPSVMNEMNMNYRYQNDVHRLQIGFVYRKWLPSSLIKKAPSILPPIISNYPETKTFPYIPQNPITAIPFGTNN